MTLGRHSLVAGNVEFSTPITIGARSGLMTGISADADVYALRNVHSKPFAVTMVRVRWVTTTAFASAQSMAVRLSKVYNFTAVHTGGTPISVQGHYRCPAAVINHPSTTWTNNITSPIATGDRLPLTAISTVISSTAAITPNLATDYTAADSDEPDIYAVSAGSTMPALYEDWQPRDGMPLILEQNTGLLGELDIAMGGSGIGRLYIGVDGFFL